LNLDSLIVCVIVELGVSLSFYPGVR